MGVNRQLIERYLAQAERHIAEGERHIAQQRELVDRLERAGHDLTTAVELLNMLETQSTVLKVTGGILCF
jgi:hypothetical protein